ncbi:class F sortase [Streptacidiphilus sp. N1-10]|uniref:Class F sortase n=1 Tax=Streptacidiphilus jeojiensis TaxID=3229225 RepID=A0ABV6XF49_9ACTN
MTSAAPATRPRTSPRLRRILTGTPASLALLAGALLIAHGLRTPTPPPQPTAAQGFAAGDQATAAPAVSSHPASAGPQPLAVLAPAVPTRVRIPAIGVDAPLTALYLEPDGQLAAPSETDRNLAGWYRAGTSPGSIGTAIIAGHVDTHQGPAVFYGLGALKKGNTIEVDRADHVDAFFTVDAVEAYAATGFPDRKVYAPAARPELRLITCGAGFDKKRQQYLGNVVVFAHMTGNRPG